VAARVRDWAAALEPLSRQPGDDDHARTQKAQFTLAKTLIIPAGVIWGLVYLWGGATTAAIISMAYAVLSSANLLLLRRTHKFWWYQTSELALVVALPFLLQLALGGYVAGSAVVLWAILGPLFAVMYASERQAVIWFGVFLVVVIGAGVAQPSLDPDNPLPHWLISSFFVLNVGVVSSIALGILLNFVHGRERLRQLERAYLDQSVMLRQREKLATLGTLAAGVAHELNNPAAAVRRAAEQLRPVVDGLRANGLDLAGDGDDRRTATRLADRAPARRTELSPLQRSMLEQELEDWLDDHGVPEPWEVASSLVTFGMTSEDLDDLAGATDPRRLAAAVCLLAEGHAAVGLAAAIADGARRISDIVNALRSYAYLDRGTVQVVDLTEGLENTLVLLRPKLNGIDVRREYAPDLPAVPVRGNELNQVWTNILDNAIDATGGHGTVTIRTVPATLASGAAAVRVEIEDDGHGMPPEVAARVFDPFFTTKAPGHGTGLGLNISFNIVVQQHGGEIAVASMPGRTTFGVSIPRTGVPVATEATDPAVLDADAQPVGVPAA
jgi:signal transduction histidine kinase